MHQVEGGETVTNTEMLNQLIQEKGLKKIFLAKQIGLTPAGFYNCVNNLAEFRASQIDKLCDLLGIDDPEQRMAIFFAQRGA